MAGWGDFWTQGETYGANQDWYDTPLVQAGEKDNGTFLRMLTRLGLMGNNRKSDFAASLQPKFNAGFDAASASNPLLTKREYLQGFDPNFINNQWNDLTPQQQGQDPSRFANSVRIQRRG